MSRGLLVAVIAVLGVGAPEALSALAQRSAPSTVVDEAEVDCPALLGAGVSTGRAFCDVLTGRDPAAGVIIRIPPHRGEATLRFELHNRHTYSEQQVRAGRAFARYTATIGVLTLDNVLLARAVVQSEFRTASDLLDRVAGGAGPGGVKAVAPTGTEFIAVSIPADVTEVSVLGERLRVEHLEGRDLFSAPGRPIAVVSNVTVEYQPARGTRRE